MMPERAIGATAWGSFEIDGDDGCLRLAQCDRVSFALRSVVTYRGRTGLEGDSSIPPESLEAIRTVTPADLPETDLASVPVFLRWFVSSYGRHTPAALIHDHLIGVDPPIPGISAQKADRYFRHMLEDLGIRFIRRWLMWTATAFRTRFVGAGYLRLSLVVWTIAATLGTSTLLYGLVSGAWLTVGLTLAAPLPAALLWGRQYGAGLVAAYFGGPWILPPTIFAMICYLIYASAEYLFGKVFGARRSGTEPIRYQYF